MSGAGVQPSLAPPPSVVPGQSSVISELLHALNQPLTGLQCSLELAVARPRPSAEYVRTLQDALQLCARMRILVGAVREVNGSARQRLPAADFVLDTVVSNALAELRRVADAKGIELAYKSSGPLPVHAEQGHIEKAIFRLLDALIGMARPNSELQITAQAEDGNASIGFVWIAGPPGEFSPWSAQELGYLVARVEWEQAGGQSKLNLAGDKQSCLLQMRLAPQGGAATEGGKQA